MKFFLRFSLILLLSLFLNVTGFSQPVTEIYPLIVSYRADRGSLERFYFVSNSPERRERFKTFYNDYLNKLEQLPFESMSVGGKVDYLLMKRDLQNELYLLNTEEKEYTQIKKYTAPVDPVYQWEQQRRRGKHLPSEEVAKQLNEIYKNIAGATAKLKSEPNLTRELAARA